MESKFLVRFICIIQYCLHRGLLSALLVPAPYLRHCTMHCEKLRSCKVSLLWICLTRVQDRTVCFDVLERVKAGSFISKAPTIKHIHFRYPDRGILDSCFHLCTLQNTFTVFTSVLHEKSNCRRWVSGLMIWCIAFHRPWSHLLPSGWKTSLWRCWRQGGWLNLYSRRFFHSNVIKPFSTGWTWSTWA